MKDLIAGIRIVLKEIQQERGALGFAALIEREEAPYKYDLVLGADWIKDRREFIKYVYPKLQQRFDEKQLSRFGGIIVLSSSSEFVTEFNQRVGPVGKDADISRMKIGPVSILTGYVFSTMLGLAQAA